MFQAGLVIYTINRNGGKAHENEGELYIKVGISCTVIIMLHQCMVDKMKSSRFILYHRCCTGMCRVTVEASGSKSYISII